MEVPKCAICDKAVPDYKPQICCNAFDCGCQGKPVDPPICSNECWEKFLKDKQYGTNAKNIDSSDKTILS